MELSGSISLLVILIVVNIITSIIITIIISIVMIIISSSRRSSSSSRLFRRFPETRIPPKEPNLRNPPPSDCIGVPDQALLKESRGKLQQLLLEIL